MVRLNDLKVFSYPRGVLAVLLISMVFIVYGATASAGDDTADAEPLIFDIGSAIDYALEHNTRFRRTAISLRLAELDFDLSSAILEPQFNAGLDASHTRTGGLSYESQVLTGTDALRYEAEMSYSKLLPAGDAFTLSFGGNRSYYKSAYLGEAEDTLPSYMSALGITYSRPLLKGFGSSITLAGIRRSKIDVAITKAATDAARAELIFAVRVAYLRVVAAREAIGVAEVSLAEAESLYNETKARVKAGQLASYQEIAAEAGLYSRREELLSAKGEYEKSLNGLKEILGIDFAAVIEIASGFDIQMPEIDTETAVVDALNQRPEILELRHRRARAEVELKVARDSLRPELGFTGGFGMQGEDFDYFGSINEMDNFSWFAGLKYTIPLGGNQAAVAQMEMARLAIDDIELQLKDIEDSIRREVLDALVELDSTSERLKVAEAGLEAADAKIESERKRFELGLITAGDLLEYEREFTQAQFNVIYARIDYLATTALLAKLTHSG